MDVGELCNVLSDPAAAFLRGGHGPQKTIGDALRKRGPKHGVRVHKRGGTLVVTVAMEAEGEQRNVEMDTVFQELRQACDDAGGSLSASRFWDVLSEGSAAYLRNSTPGGSFRVSQFLAKHGMKHGLTLSRGVIRTDAAADENGDENGREAGAKKENDSRLTVHTAGTKQQDATTEENSAYAAEERRSAAAGRQTAANDKPASARRSCSQPVGEWRSADRTEADVAREVAVFSEICGLLRSAGGEMDIGEVNSALSSFAREFFGEWRQLQAKSLRKWRYFVESIGWRYGVAVIQKDDGSVKLNVSEAWQTCRGMDAVFSELRAACEAQGGAVAENRFLDVLSHGSRVFLQRSSEVNPTSALGLLEKYGDQYAVRLCDGAITAETLPKQEPEPTTNSDDDELDGDDGSTLGGQPPSHAPPRPAESLLVQSAPRAPPGWTARPLRINASWAPKAQRLGYGLHGHTATQSEKCGHLSSRPPKHL